MLRVQFCRTINGGSERLSCVPEATQLKTAEPRTLSFQGRIPSSRAQGSSRSWLSLWMQRFGGLTLFLLDERRIPAVLLPHSPCLFWGDDVTSHQQVLHCHCVGGEGTRLWNLSPPPAQLSKSTAEGETPIFTESPPNHHHQPPNHLPTSPSSSQGPRSGEAQF